MDVYKMYEGQQTLKPDKERKNHHGYIWTTLIVTYKQA